MIRRAHYRNAQRTLYRLLELGIVPVVNENDTVATDEIRVGDNDRLAALVAHLLHADLLVLLSDVEGLYDGDPSRGDAHAASATSPETPTSPGSSSAGPVAPASAPVAWPPRSRPPGSPPVRGCTWSWRRRLKRRRPWRENEVGTCFTPTAARIPTRLLWLAHAATPRGRVTLDAGAVRAVIDRRLSLLPAGITAVDGDFEAGDPVDLLDENGHVVARGLVNFGVTELPGLLGRSTRDLARELGPAYEREVVHRDDLVLLRR